MKIRALVATFILTLVIGGCSLSVTTSQDAGIYYSNNKGQTWEHRTFVQLQNKKTVSISKLDVSYFVFHPTDPNIIFISTKESGIYYTINKGAQWQQTTLRNGFYPAFSIDPSTPALMYAATGSTIVKSSDGGQTWQQMYVDRPGVSVTALAVDPISTNRVWAGNSAGVIFKSEDFGQTWKIATILIDNITRIVMPDISGTTFYVLSPKLGITKTTDGGGSWSQSPTVPLAAFSGAMPITSFSLRPGSTKDLLIGSKYGLLHSLDGGDAWTPINTIIPTSSLPIQSAVMHPSNSSIVMFIAANTFYLSDDYGATWKTLKTIPTNQNVSTLVIHPTFTDDLYVGITKVKK